MIYGIGCDICEIARIKNTKEGFASRYFTEGEQELFEKRKNRPQTIAANFAVKEAFSKALGTGISGFSLKDIEVLRDDKGKPYINLYNNAKKLCDVEGIDQIHTTISHTDELCIAYVLLEKMR